MYLLVHLLFETLQNRCSKLLSRISSCLWLDEERLPASEEEQKRLAVLAKDLEVDGEDMRLYRLVQVLGQDPV